MAVVNLFPFCRPVLEKSAGHLAGLNYLASPVGTELLLLKRRNPLQSYSLTPPSNVLSFNLMDCYPVTRGVAMGHLLGYFKNQKDLSIWQPKAEKRKHDSGKLSDGDKIDLLIII